MELRRCLYLTSLIRVMAEEEEVTRRAAAARRRRIIRREVTIRKRVAAVTTRAAEVAITRAAAARAVVVVAAVVAVPQAAVLQVLPAAVVQGPSMISKMTSAVMPRATQRTPAGTCGILCASPPLFELLLLGLSAAGLDLTNQNVFPLTFAETLLPLRKHFDIASRF